MTPEKKNRILSIIFAAVTIVSLALTVFLLINYLRVKAEIDSMKSSSNSSQSMKLPEVNSESGQIIIYYA
jgi:hypothetical protein